jgi:type I restriction enzyme S subunit
MKGNGLDTTRVRRWRRYPTYRPCQTDWLSEIPEHWAAKRLQFLCKLSPAKSEVAHLPDDAEASFLPMECIGVDGSLVLDRSRPLGEVRQGFTYFRDGDVVVAKITPCFENGKGALAKDLLNGVGFGTTELHVLRPGPGLEARYLELITRLHAFRQLGATTMYGAAGQQRVPESFLRDYLAPLPPVSEQRAIAVFLDRETARIDALIEKKERLIALLEEKRQAIISHAVTRGLDPNATLKDSGVAWLGKVPATWSITRLKFVADIQSGLTLGKDYGGRILVERPYLRVANVQDGFLDLDEITTVQLPPADVSRHELRPGDVLMTEGGDYDKLGRGYVWEGQIPGCLHQNHVFAVRPNQNRLRSHYLAAVMTSTHGRNYFTFTSQQSTNLASTNATKLGNFPIPLSNVHEQDRILDDIRERSDAVSGTLSRIRDGIAHLQEYRTALISATVTGQIDVRQEAAP